MATILGLEAGKFKGLARLDDLASSPARSIMSHTVLAGLGSMPEQVWPELVVFRDRRRRQTGGRNLRDDGVGRGEPDNLLRNHGEMEAGAYEPSGVAEDR